MTCSKTSWSLIVALAVGACSVSEPPTLDAEPREPWSSPQATASAGPAPEPSLAMPAGHVVIGPDREVPVRVEHTRLARLRLAPLTVADLRHAQRVVGTHPGGSDALRTLPKALLARVKAYPQRATGAEPDAVDVFSLTKSELVLAVLEAPGASTLVAIFQRGELNVLMKTGGQAGLVWVTSARTGKPVVGADVVLQQGQTPRFRAKTDGQGVARLPADGQLRARVPMVGRDDLNQPLLAVVRSGKHLAVTSEHWTTGIEPWQFQLPEVYYTGQDAIRGTITAERGMYRPGDGVHLLGVLRERRGSGKLVPPTGAAKLRVTDPDGNEVFSDDVALSQFGTFRSRFELPRTTRLGRYSIVASKGASELRGGFEVGEYRPVRFEVTVPSGSLEPAATLRLPVSARYLYGAPVAAGELSWQVSAREKRRFGSWADGFTFASNADGGELVSLATGEAKLDASGATTIELGSASVQAIDGDLQAVELVVEATVKDAGGDSVSGHGVQSLVRTPALLGLRSDAWVVDSSQGWTVKLAVVGSDGAPKPGQKVKLDLVRKKWVGVAGQHGTGVRYQGSWQDEIVESKRLTSTGRTSDVHFALPAGGEYRAVASIEGHDSVVSESVWAYGADAYGGWDHHARMKVHADKTSYRPGERAKLYAEVPYERAYALLTLERDGVLEHRTLQLEGSSAPIEITITDSMAPNVFASIAVVPAGLGKEAPLAGPPLKLGYRELAVSAEQRRLTVSVRPATTRARPGDTADVEVQVSDAAGRPARAEVTLWAADEGVLQLTGYATPDPFIAAYERHAHQVRTAASLLRFSSDVETRWDEYGGDDAPGDDASAAFRSRFLGTAFFSKGVVTDARGQARVQVPLPDNLTRWRVMAAVADSGDRFGSGQASIETSKPLQIEPALPRFLTRGDRLDATVLVHNQTSAKGSAKVRLDVTGAVIEGSATQALELAAGAQAPVRFSLRAQQLGTVRVRATAELGSERDAFQVELPVHSPTLWQTKLLAEGRLDETRKVALDVPKTAERGQTELVVNVAPGVLASLGGSVDALMEYPHGCVEQTTSRLIPMVLLEEVLRSSGDPRLAGGQHRKKMEHAVAHVLRHQNPNGGFGLWPGSESEGFLTAYALWGLLTAKDGGYSVPAGSLRRGLAYLERNARDGDDMHGQFAAQETPPFSAFVLAAAKHSDGGLSEQLTRTGKLTPFGTGLLGAALAEREQKPDALLARLASSRKKNGGGALIADGSASTSDLFDYGRDLRATAAMVRALTLSGRARDADDLVAGILAERRSDGSWGTTYNNLWALHAIVDHGKHGGAGAASGRVRLGLDDKSLATLELDRKSRFKTAVVGSAQLPEPGKGSNLVLTGPAGSSLRYSARLRWASTVAAQAPVDRGFSVKRELLDAKSGAPVTTPAQGQLLRVRLTLTASEGQEQVALIDRLPAGFEAVDTALATSQKDPQASTTPAGDWVWRELHDERVTHFADYLPAGTHTAEYLVRATRTGTFLRPAPSAEAMYSPDVFGHGAIDTISVKP